MVFTYLGTPIDSSINKNDLFASEENLLDSNLYEHVIKEDHSIEYLVNDILDMQRQMTKPRRKRIIKPT